MYGCVSAAILLSFGGLPQSVERVSVSSGYRPVGFAVGGDTHGIRSSGSRNRRTEKLIDIRSRQAELEECCQRADASKADVSEAVFKRVMRDYKDRLRALDNEAAPLRLEARKDHEALQASYAQVQQANEQASLQKEELLFRHKVGEFDQSVLEDRIQQPEQKLAECAESLADLDDRRARFLEAFGGEDSLKAFMAEAPKPEPPKPAVPKPEAPKPAPPKPPTPPRPPESPKTIVAPVAAPPVPRAEPARPHVEPEEPEPPPPDSDGDKTRFVSLDSLGIVNGEFPSAATAEPDEESSASSDPKTMILPSAVLVVRIKGETPTEFAVSPFTTIGRSEHNNICVPRRNVSREHATIQAAANGFVLKDLGSQNGTLVNGDTVTERLLEDGGPHRDRGRAD